jgi:Tfp pilus assembly protein PilN
MTRQINLNSKTLLPGYGPVQLPLFLAAIAVALLASGIWSYLAWAQRQSLLAEEQQWNVTLNEQLQALTEFQATNPKVENEPALLAENEKLNQQLKKARETYSGLANQVENAVDGFHQSLTQLSDYDLNGLWLNKITLKDGKRYFSLAGFARNPELIPQYLEQLGQSEFQGLTIAQMSVAKEADSELWRFTLSNSTDVAEQGAR